MGCESSDSLGELKNINRRYEALPPNSSHAEKIKWVRKVKCRYEEELLDENLDKKEGIKRAGPVVADILKVLRDCGKADFSLDSQQLICRLLDLLYKFGCAFGENAVIAREMLPFISSTPSLYYARMGAIIYLLYCELSRPLEANTHHAFTVFVGIYAAYHELAMSSCAGERLVSTAVYAKNLSSAYSGFESSKTADDYALLDYVEKVMRRKWCWDNILTIIEEGILPHAIGLLSHEKNQTLSDYGSTFFVLLFLERSFKCQVLHPDYLPVVVKMVAADTSRTIRSLFCLHALLEGGGDNSVFVEAEIAAGVVTVLTLALQRVVERKKFCTRNEGLAMVQLVHTLAVIVQHGVTHATIEGVNLHLPLFTGQGKGLVTLASFFHLAPRMYGEYQFDTNSLTESLKYASLAVYGLVNKGNVPDTDTVGSFEAIIKEARTHVTMISDKEVWVMDK